MIFHYKSSVKCLDQQVCCMYLLVSFVVSTSFRVWMRVGVKARCRSKTTARLHFMLNIICVGLWYQDVPAGGPHKYSSACLRLVSEYFFNGPWEGTPWNQPTSLLNFNSKIVWLGCFQGCSVALHDSVQTKTGDSILPFSHCGDQYPRKYAFWTCFSLGDAKSCRHMLLELFSLKLCHFWAWSEG